MNKQVKSFNPLNLQQFGWAYVEIGVTVYVTDGPYLTPTTYWVYTPKVTRPKSQRTSSHFYGPFSTPQDALTWANEKGIMRNLSTQIISIGDTL